MSILQGCLVAEEKLQNKTAAVFSRVRQAEFLCGRKLIGTSKVKQKAKVSLVPQGACLNSLKHCVTK